MAEYSRLASGQVVSTGGATTVVVPFIPDFIEISNSTRATAASGVTRAWWEKDMGQGAAFVVTTGAGPADGTSFISAATGGGFTTVQAGLALQYGPTVFLGASGSISKANPAVVTTTAAHGLVSGNVVIFQNLYQTTTTGMQQIAGIPFVVTVTGSTTFTIPWNTNQSNYTAIATGGLNTNASFKQVLYPSLYVPGIAFISAITTGSTTTIVTTAPHNMVVGQEVGFRIPTSWGTTQLNELPNVLIPGSPIYGYVVSVTNSTTVVVSINSTGYTAFNSNQVFANFPGEKFPQIIAVGDVNTGGQVISAGSALYPSPLVYNGTSTGQVSTINGPAINGAYINATYMGFIIGASVAGTVSDTIYWRAYMHDLSL
jgi:hypothetical protein